MATYFDEDEDGEDQMQLGGNPLVGLWESDDEILGHAAETTERQVEHQRQLGGNPGSSDPGRLRFVPEPLFERESPRFLVHERVVRLRPVQEGNFIPTDRLADALIQGLRSAVEGVLNRYRVPDQDRFYVSLASDRLRSASNAFFVTAKNWREQGLRMEELLNNLSKMLNSNEQFELDDSFQLSVVHVQPHPRGSGPKRRPKKRPRHVPGYLSDVQLEEVKKSRIKIRRDAPGWCAALAIVTAKALAEIEAQNLNPKRKQKVQREWTDRKRNRNRLFEAALNLLGEVKMNPGAWGHEELERVVQAPSLRDYKIVVIHARRSYLSKAYGRGPTMLGLLFKDDHYDALSSIKGYLVKNYFCETCFRGYDSEGRHRCPGNRAVHCSSCGQNTCQEYREAFKRYQSPTVECPDCHRTFFGPQCLDKHKAYTLTGQAARGTNSVCHKRQKCADCHLYMDTQKEIQRHKCGFAECHCCDEYVHIESHQCFVQQASKEQAKDYVPPLHVFFDIECQQGTHEHIPNLLVCGRADEERPHHWYGEDCVYKFLLQLEQWSEGGKQPLTVLAHNFMGYDSYPVIEKLHMLCSKLKQIRNGGKVLQLTCFKNIRFIDSMSFIPMKLSKFSKTFDLRELKKGYFPHLFNKEENQEYKGPLPPVEDYLPNSMSEDEKKEFLAWHAKEQARLVAENKQFIFQEELLEYCKSDVKLLKEGCLQFKQEFEAEAGFDPFEQMTIASACNRFLRTHCLEKDTIAVEPLRGWGGRKVNQSSAAFEWLAWEGQDKILRHALNGGEFKPLPGHQYTVDGYHEETRTVYEFDGCFWHGCPKCFPQRHEPHPRHLDKTMADVYADREEKHRLLKEAKYNIVNIWECEWKRLRDREPPIQEFLKTHRVPQPLDPRDAFFGGRTNAYCLYYKVQEGEEVHYYDFKSLYPFVNKNGEYPVGHPEILSNAKVEDVLARQYFGLIRCTVVPPTDLLHPVLPYRCSEKLTFPLCATCVKENIDLPLHTKKLDTCTHGPEQRALTGTWCTPEVYKALDKGYTFHSVDQVYHFKERKKLFGKYINTWLKHKEEASGYPQGCDTEDQQREHIRGWAEREKIDLNPEKIAHNPGRRFLSKQMLNSMWGKFGQATNKMQVKEFVDPPAFWKFLDSNQPNIKYVSPLNADRVEVHYTMQEHCERDSPHLNIFVAAFTTCLARLKLYDVMDQLGERCLYSDTDSIIFVQRPGDTYQPPLGDFLGEFTNELKQGDHIVEFCSGGPKNYGYKTHLGHVECKVRGFSLNAEGKSQLNYDVLRRNTLEELTDALEEPRTTPITWTHTIHRNVKEYLLETKRKIKDYKLVYTKRILDPETFYTYPYGYRSQDQQNAMNLMDLTWAVRDRPPPRPFLYFFFRLVKWGVTSATFPATYCPRDAFYISFFLRDPIDLHHVTLCPPYFFNRFFFLLS